MKFKSITGYLLGFSVLVSLTVGAGFTFAGGNKATYRETLWDYLMVLDSFGPRFPGSEGYQKAQKFILQVGNQFADEVHEQSFTVKNSVGGAQTLTNFEFFFKGTRPGKAVLFGAHYDTRPFADEEINPERREKPIPGANDGGSGTAVLLGLAQFLSENPPEQPVKLVFFDGEDFGKKSSGQMLLGSTFYANELKKLDKSQWPLSLVVVDMVGDRDLQIFVEATSKKNAPWLVDLIYGIAKENNIPQFHNKVRYSIFDDHTPLSYLGIPSVVLIDFDYPHWHRLDDTLDKCSADSLFAVFSVVTEVLGRIDPPAGG